LYYALEAPQIFLVNHIRCRDCGGELVLENEELEYTDENACVRIVGTMTCKPCGSKQPHESLTVLSDTRSLAKAKAVRLDVRHEKTTLTVPPDDRQSVLISYSHKDRIWLERLQTHLAPLQRNGLFDLWDDTRIQAGERWKEEIAAALSNSKVAILLVTPHFLASDFIAENELPQLIDLAREQRLAILWIAVSASLYSETPIAELQAVNDPSRPLDTLSSSERSRVMVEICRQVQNAIRDGQGM
jgi:hypothetical protein